MSSSLHELLITLGRPEYFITFITFCGLILGGLTTVVGDRLGQVAIAEDNGEEIPENMGISFPPSRCENCNRTLKTIERLPIIGWIVTKGGCGCGFRIPVIYPLAEFSTMLVFLLIAIKFGPSVNGLMILVAAWLFIALSVADIRHFVLPDRLTLSLLWIGLMGSAGGWLPHGAGAAIFGVAAGYSFLWILRELHFYLRGVIGIGGGDLKLLAAIGAWVGIENLFLTAALAAILGLILSVLFAILPKREGGYSPFGPSLALAGLTSLFFPQWVTIVLNGLLHFFSA